MDFVKMHVCGNDFVVIDTCDKMDTYVKTLCKRTVGIGADGIIVISETDIADVRIDVYNADGSVAVCCGSALLAAAKYMCDVFQGERLEWRIAMRGQIYEVEISENKVIANMGAPITEVSRIPCLWDEEKMIGVPFTFMERSFKATCVGFGSSHMVFFDESEDILCDENVFGVGRALEKDKMFPNGANICFVRVLSRNHVRIRVWERGCGETQACCGAACAAVTATILAGKTDHYVHVEVRGGGINVWYEREKDALFLEGAPVRVYEGKCCLDKVKVVY